MDTVSTAPRAGSLSVRISIRLAVAALLAVAVEIVVVFALYNTDPQKLAEQLVSIQADRVAEAIDTAGAIDPARLDRLRLPRGVQDWGFAIHDPAGRRIYVRAPSSDAADAALPVPAGFTSTRRVAAGVERITGTRLVATGGGDLWVTMSLSGRGGAMFAPVYLHEALDHVVLPVLPLTLLLILVNIIIVRRMLAPLSAAAAEVDALEPASMNARLTEPDTGDEVRALVAAVNRALDRLQHAMATLEAFTADAAHEMRTPLAVLSLRIDELESTPLKERLRDDVAAMTRLVNQMLDLAQADTLDVGAGEPIDLVGLARDVAARMVPIAYARGCEICVSDNDAAPVRGHREALARVLGNLVDNALALSPAGSAIDVVVGPRCRITVRDRGPGLGEADVERLFQRFWRGPERAQDGAGLGLAIARSILAKHGATIDAANAAGGGAVFTIFWPEEGTK